MTLTDYDRQLINRARAIRDLESMDAIRQHTGDDDTTTALINLLGEAKWVLSGLANTAERLGADTSRLRNDRARYRIQLAFPPDTDDRQALREARQP
jgi:hypothetical protein